ncbi:M20 family metallopeptidase [Flavobacteriales bacterium]|nr:M20 family metallopeptidase [Flavobacteriales bacterium]
MIEEIKRLSNEYFEEILNIRRYLHKHPELSFKEFQTSKYIKDTLNSWGIEFTEGYANTGILVTLNGDVKTEKVIALRADFDALPIHEENDVFYKSINHGIMHACGHDAHTASMLGALKILNELRSKWSGIIKFIFQPAEEMLPGGAKQMIKDGVLLSPNVTEMLAQHVLPELESGKVGFKEGKYMASTDEIYINVIGKGGHAALPQNYNNPLLPTSDLILTLNKVFLNRNHKNSIFALGYVYAKGSTNVIPDNVNLKGTFRALTEDHRDIAHQEMRDVVEKIEKKYNVKIDLDIRKGYPALFNDEKITKKHILNAKKYLGTENVVELPVRMTAEDFSYFANKVPSCFYRIGVGNPSAKYNYGLHTSKFNIEESSLKIGMGLMAYLTISS